MLAVMNHCSCFKELAKNARFKKGGISEICSDTLNILLNMRNHKHGHYLIVKTNLTAEIEYWLSLCMHSAIVCCYSNLFFSYLYIIILLGYYKSFLFFCSHSHTLLKKHKLMLSGKPTQNMNWMVPLLNESIFLWMST